MGRLRGRQPFASLMRQGYVGLGFEEIERRLYFIERERRKTEH